jgi:methylated-DNA-protein-cysteine methyltransferase-like protein
MVFLQAWRLTPLRVIFFDMPGDWNKVYALVKRIPKGRVLTYGQVARATRLPGGARAAGRAMAACPRGQAIPWHRVVAAGGRIAVREPFASLQRRLLESEGARFVERRVAAECVWAPPLPRKSRPKTGRQKSGRRRLKRSSRRPRA